eukprot:9101346-Karenia_brevis.AAC.1
MPWPVILALTLYNKKHISAHKRLPSMKEVLESAKEVGERMKWRWYFAKVSSAKDPDNWYGRLKPKGPTAPYCMKERPPIELEWWCQHL